MGWIWLAGVVWAGASDVEAMRRVTASPETVTEYLSDLARVAALFPEPCAQKWSFDVADDGGPPQADVVYRAGWLRRKLTLTYGDVVPGSHVDLDHPGDKGFVTRFRVTEGEGGGSDVTLTTYLTPPRWPLVNVYTNQIQPIWRDCHVRTLDALAGSLAP